MDLKAEIEKCGKAGVVSLVLAIFGASGFFNWLWEYASRDLVMTMMFVIIIANSVIVIVSERENTEIKIKLKNIESKFAIEQNKANKLDEAFCQLRLAYQKKAGLTFVEKKVDITWNGPSEPETWKPEDLYSNAVRIADKARVG